MANITPPFDFSESLSYTASQLNTWLETATVTAIVGTDIDSSIKNGSAATPMLRSIITDGSSTTSGYALGAADTRISKIDSSGYADAKTLHFDTDYPLDTSAISSGKYLLWNGTKITGGTPSSTAAQTGTGTITTTSASPMTATGARHARNSR